MNSLKVIGPILSDTDFFATCIDYTIEGLEGISSAVLVGDYTRCRKIFGDYVRSNLKKEIFFKSLTEETTPLMHDELIKKASMALGHIVEPCGIPYDFKGEPIDWFYNATSNGYREWTWQLSRHAEILILAKAYRKTKEERYADKCCELINSWIKQAICPSDNENPNTSLCWRTIECGIRMSLVWPEILHSIFESPAFNDDIITDWYKSVYEHAEIIQNFHTTGNWLIMEMSGLLHIGLIYPCFKKSEKWLNFAEQKLIEELKLQVYPDGFQYELSSGYQNILVIHYGKIIRILTGYGRTVPENFKRVLRDLLYVYVKLMRPNGALPDVNDGTLAMVSDKIQPYYDLFPEDNILLWVASGGEYGDAPVETSYVLPYAGCAVFRSGWEKNDVWLYFDGGPFGRAHQHEDKLNLLLHANGRYVLTEGNNYAYDDSEMRKYVLSTRAHNTVLVDGMGQNRGADYKWEKDDIKKHCEIYSNLSEHLDYIGAVYNDGYGMLQDKSVTHKRCVYFIKDIRELSPVVVVVDRLIAKDKEHRYEVQWHIDAENITADGLNITADSLKFFVPNQKTEGVRLSIQKGVTAPEWNGWTADSVVQNDYRPIYIAKHILFAQNVRWVTVLYPQKNEDCNILGVSASGDIADTRIDIELKDGKVFSLDEDTNVCGIGI